VKIITHPEQVVYWAQVHRHVEGCRYSYSCGTGSILEQVHRQVKSCKYSYSCGTGSTLDTGTVVVVESKLYAGYSVVVKK
jgi:hypothetical protein